MSCSRHWVYTGSFAKGESASVLDEQGFMELVNKVGSCGDLINRGAYDRVVEQLVPVIRDHPGMVDARVFLGTALAGLGRHEEAEYVLTETLALAPKSVAAMVALINPKLEQGKKKDAITLIEKVVERSPKRAPRLFLPILTDYDLFPLAEQMANGVLREDPDFVPAQIAKARAHVLRGQPQMALPLLEKARTTTDPKEARTTADILFHQGDAFARLDRVPEALDAFGQAIAVRPDHRGARSSMALVLFSLGRPKQALANLDAWLQAAPGATTARAAAEICEIVGLPDQARAYRDQFGK